MRRDVLIPFWDQSHISRISTSEEIQPTLNILTEILRLRLFCKANRNIWKGSLYHGQSDTTHCSHIIKNERETKFVALSGSRYTQVALTQFTYSINNIVQSEQRTSEDLLFNTFQNVLFTMFLCFICCIFFVFVLCFSSCIFYIIKKPNKPKKLCLQSWLGISDHLPRASLSHLANFLCMNFWTFQKMLYSFLYSIKELE